MRFWDASAVVPIVIAEPSTAAVVALLHRDPHVVVWWTTEVECVSAITRREREGALDAAQVVAATARLEMLRAAWEEVEPGSRLRQTATRLLRVHPLRAADALQLAAAITMADADPGTLPFVTLDERLARAAEREGFPVIEPS
ncbi:MAG TPA: type II toxin-antitoxin system VapC family toxin [Candidatus Limnocylindrales bacterium]|nr:type II toxin-antitoxin system VapC family toxin [Candidatus Limnocylindrales bacterium]